MFKNVAASFMVYAFDSTTGLPKTGDAANITAYVSKDYGAVTVLADTTATEMDATNAKGYYLFAAAQGETNADCLMVSAKSATANIVVIGAPAVIYTRPTTGWLAPTIAGRTLDVSAGGEAGVDWANVGSPTTVVGLTGTTVKTATDVETDTADIQTRLPAALVSGRIDASVGAMAADVITAAATAADFTTEVTAGLSTLDAAGVRTAVGLASANLDTQLGAIDDYIDTEVAAIKVVTDKLATTLEAAGGSPGEFRFAADALVNVADVVWDELLSGHAIVGSTGAALSAAGGSGDPWATALPGAYGAGTAGKIIGDNINATISSRASQTSVDTLAGYVDTEVAAIKAKTDLIPAAPAAVSDIPTAIENADALLNRDMSTGTDSGSPTVRTVRQALRFLRNKWSIAGTTLTVTKEDDATASWTATVSTSAGADPVTGSDPA